MNQDWKGNTNSIFVTLGASNHFECVREENDYYATEPKAVELLLENETFNHTIWECACGGGHIGKVLENHGYKVIGTDIVYRGYGVNKSLDFFKSNKTDLDVDIVTNPPYKYAKEFVEKSLNSVRAGRKVAMFLKIQFLEGIARREMFDENPPKVIYVFSKRVNCAKNGDFDKCPSSAIAYAWFVWEKGYKGNPIIKWIN